MYSYCIFDTDIHVHAMKDKNEKCCSLFTGVSAPNSRASTPVMMSKRVNSFSHGLVGCEASNVHVAMATEMQDEKGNDEFFLPFEELVSLTYTLGICLLST